MSHSVRSGVTALVLLAVGMGTGLAAWALYPDPEYPDRAEPMIVTVISESEIEAVLVDIYEDFPESNSWKITVTAMSPSDLNNDEQTPAIHFAFPRTLALSLECDPDVPCEGGNEMFTDYRLFRTRIDSSPPWEQSADDATLKTASTTLTLHTDNPPSINCTEISCRGSLPAVRVSDGTPRSTGALAKTSFMWVDEPGVNDYRWDSSAVVRAWGFDLTFSEELSVEYATSLEAQTSIDGVNEAVSRRVTNEIFLSGALVGVAGGAIVGALQESTHWLSSRRAADSTSPTQAPKNADRVEGHESNRARRRRQKRR